MHSACFGAYTRHSYICPVCSRSLGDMSVYWKMLDSLLAGEQQMQQAQDAAAAAAGGEEARAAQQAGQAGHAPAVSHGGGLPPEYANRRQALLCNDCGAAGDAPWHFVYHKCGQCGSYNTRVTG